MPYEYDVFLSYSRVDTHARWVNETFLQLFKDYLADAANVRDLRVFQDTQAIASADDWQQRIRHALARSKCMVAIWSPAYFNSEWCLREFAVMWHRGRMLQRGTVQNPLGLVHPIKIFDGEHFPNYVRSTQCADFREYFRIGEGFTRTTPYVEFQARLQSWVVGVAQGIHSAPSWSSDWLEPGWLDEPFRQLATPTRRRARKPQL